MWASSPLKVKKPVWFNKKSSWKACWFHIIEEAVNSTASRGLTPSRWMWVPVMQMCRIHFILLTFWPSLKTKFINKSSTLLNATRSKCWCICRALITVTQLTFFMNKFLQKCAFYRTENREGKCFGSIKHWRRSTFLGINVTKNGVREQITITIKSHAFECFLYCVFRPFLQAPVEPRLHLRSLILF